MIENRCRWLKDDSSFLGESQGEYVLYIMQSCQRAEENPALEVALEWAHRLEVPLIVLFTFTPDGPEEASGSFIFMLQGLQETEKTLAMRDIPLLAGLGNPGELLPEPASQARLVVLDGADRHGSARWQRDFVSVVSCPVLNVEGDVIVPLRAASDKGEIAARTLRPRLYRVLGEYLDLYQSEKKNYPGGKGVVENFSHNYHSAEYWSMMLDGAFPRATVSPYFTGGAEAGWRKFETFCEEGLEVYKEFSSQPVTGAVSYLSPYLRYGQLSPVALFSRAQEFPHSEGFLEQLLVRRELAFNHVFYAEDFGSYGSLPSWARETLEAHRGDWREGEISLERLEAADSPDPYWNACMNEMKHTGFLHNHLRMYWGKRILWWVADAAEAFAFTLSLNNRYFIDGHTPNSYAGVAWLFGLHDRPWPERKAFGKVRSMVPSGLERKGDIRTWVLRSQNLINTPRELVCTPLNEALGLAKGNKQREVIPPIIQGDLFRPN